MKPTFRFSRVRACGWPCCTLTAAALAAGLFLAAGRLAPAADDLKAAVVKVRSATACLQSETSKATTTRAIETRDGKTVVSQKVAQEVTLFSGAAISPDGLIVTYLADDEPGELFLSYPPGGAREAVRILVRDLRSGLALLKADVTDRPSLELAEESPEVGQQVLTASCRGGEQPAVSTGIVAAADTVVTSNLPPLLESDVRVTKAGAGAPLVDTAGRLVGVVAAQGVFDGGEGWTYAVPASHVRKLLDARPDDDAETVVLGRERPFLGVVLTGGDDGPGVLVGGVTAGSAAEEAELREGDRIIAVGAREIVKPVEVAAAVRDEEPGGKVTLKILRNEEERTVDVELGKFEGGARAPEISSPAKTSTRVHLVKPEDADDDSDEPHVEVVRPEGLRVVPGKGFQLDLRGDTNRGAGGGLRLVIPRTGDGEEGADGSANKQLFLELEGNVGDRTGGLSLEIPRFDVEGDGDEPKSIRLELRGDGERRRYRADIVSPRVRVTRSRRDRRIDELVKRIEQLQDELQQVLEELDEERSKADDDLSAPEVDLEPTGKQQDVPAPPKPAEEQPGE